MQTPKANLCFIFFIATGMLCMLAGCTKDYSYERGNTIPAPVDSLPPQQVHDFSVCALCKASDPLLEGRWSFKLGNTFLCGDITDGIITSDKNALTFFGPSACSLDTGLVITAYLEPLKLTSDMSNVVTNKMAFYYYDHNATSYIFISQPTALFSLTIDQFIYSTKMATGTFTGVAFKPNGETVIIKEGKFNVKLR